MAFYKHWILFVQPCDIYRDSPRGVPRWGQNVQKNVLKLWTFKLQAWITGKRLKIDGYIQRGVLQALNPLSNRVTFTAIVQGHTQGRPKCAKNVPKWRTFGLQAWITGKQLKIDGYIQQDVLQASNPLSNRVTFTAIVPGATLYGGVKCKGGRKKLRFPTNISL